MLSSIMDVEIDVPDGQSGNWSVETFTVSAHEAEFENLRSLIGSSSRPIRPGTYKRLVRSGNTIMSNTPIEIRDCGNFLWRAKGRILINGLGLGVVVKCLLGKSEVTSITVIEKSEDVMKLVAPYYQDPRLTIIHADAFEYKPPKGEVYDYVWHDIWDDISADNLPEMAKLHRKYGRRTKWQDSWCKSLIKSRQGRRGKWIW